ncbi:MAG TPA: serine/threonine-protein kinase [Iamia sp.]
MTSGSGGPEVPGYRDLHVLGRGGFATVYRARQDAFDREVALKVLDGAHTDERMRQLFTRECRAAGSLSWHPHVVVVHDAGTTPAGAPYLAMELLPGGSLADALATRGPLAPDEAVRVTAEVASALVAAHETDLLHRDVKPANVLVDRLGRAKLADFGIARVVGAGSATATGAVTGTVAYMAPEVLKGGKATPASDVYALGLTLLTFLLGRNPLTAEGDDSPFVVIARVVAGTPLEMPAGLPSEVREVIEASTATDPADRPSTADLAATLAALGSAPAPPPAPPAVAAPAPPPLAKPGSSVPPPPTSAVRVRPDHTLAEPPPPPADLDPTTPVGGGTQVAATQVAPTPGPPPSGRSRRTMALAAAGLLVVVAVVIAVLVLGGGDDTPSADGSSGSTGGETTATTDAGPTSATDIDLTPAILSAADIGLEWALFTDSFGGASVDSARENQSCPIDPATQVLQRVFERPADPDGEWFVQLVFGFADVETAERFMATDACDADGSAVDGLGDQAALDVYGEAPFETQQISIRVGAVVTQLRGPSDPGIPDALRAEMVRLVEAL